LGGAEGSLRLRGAAGRSTQLDQALARPPTEEAIEPLVLLALAVSEPLPMMLRGVTSLNLSSEGQFFVGS